VISSALLPMMTTPVTWTPFQAKAGTGFGDSTFNASTAKTVLCRIERGQRRVMGRGQQHGQETLSSVTLFARPNCTDGTAFAPKLKDKFTLPDIYDPREPPVLALDPTLDQTGINHWVISL
jgi:hypothetical protein